MQITRTSPLTFKATTLELDVTPEQMAEFEGRPRRMIQEIFPNLTPAQREFIKTGYTAEDWAAMFPPEGE